MDVSVVAAIGSFVVSERVLKPKATALFILGCVLAYDLTTKTHDVSSLRVYRGPALLAFTLMMCAYSLRTWRRNGVACDELIFLPGTMLDRSHGIDEPLVELPQQTQQQQSKHSQQPLQQQNQEPSTPLRHQRSEPIERVAASPPIRSLEGDAAGGFPIIQAPPKHRRTRSDPSSIELSSLDSTPIKSNLLLPPSSDHARSANKESVALLSDDNQTSERSEDWDICEKAEILIGSPGQVLTCRSNDSESDSNMHVDDPANLPHMPNLSERPTAVQRFRTNHPRITRLGTFFFFRSSSTSTENAEYAPSGPSVFGAALDLSMPVLFNFHLFIEAYNRIQNQGEAPAKLLPLIFLSVLMVRTMIPPGRRMRFWGTLKFTFTAPLHRIRVRDAFVGEVLTSMVRPGQDLFFALSYYITVIWGTIFGEYNLSESGEVLEHSRLLHNIILPSCAILPLWWKYLQTLRQAYDSNKRWPYQGNSLKYLISTLVIIYGMTHPKDERPIMWGVSYWIAVAYQIWWDVFMDWNLLVISRESIQVESELESCCSRISSLRPSSRVLLMLHMNVLQPLLDAYQCVRARMPSVRQIQLRPRRLYRTDGFYWKILVYNCVMRFAWMLCFIPAYHISSQGEKKALTSSSDVHSYWGVLLPVSELIRRCLWGFLFLEHETIKLMDSDSLYARVDTSDTMEEDSEDDDSKDGTRAISSQLLPTWLTVQQKVAHDAATTRSRQRDFFARQLFVVELYVWAAAFVGLGCWAAS